MRADRAYYSHEPSLSDKAAIDAGFKAFATDMPFGPECKTVRGIAYSWGGDEHGKLNLTGAEREVRLGDRLEFIIPHCDPTVNLYDCVYALAARNSKPFGRSPRGAILRISATCTQHVRRNTRDEFTARARSSTSG